METKKCKCCGRELPLSMFRKIGKRNTDEKITLGVCSDCMKAKQSEGRKKRKERISKEHFKEIETARCAKLAEFTPRELMHELARRGYEGTLRFTETHEIDINDF